MELKITKKLTSAVLVCGLAAATSHLHSQVVLSESFQSPLGSVPANWTVAKHNNTFVEIDTWGYDNGAAANGLKIVRNEPDVSGHHAYVYYSGPNHTFSNIEGSIIFQARGNSQLTGVMLRAGTGTSPTTGYYIGVRNRTSFFISSNPTSNSNQGTVLAESALSGMSVDATYRMVFSAMGTTIAASLYQWNQTDSEWVNYGSLSVNDGAHTSGNIGVRAGFGNNNSATFANLVVIPEPGHYAIGLGLLALIGAFIHRRRQHRA